MGLPCATCGRPLPVKLSMVCAEACRAENARLLDEVIAQPGCSEQLRGELEAQLARDAALTVTGADLIARERRRQVTQEGFDDAHDEGHTGDHALAWAAACYAAPDLVYRRDDSTVRTRGQIAFVDPYPTGWSLRWDKRPRAGNGAPLGNTGFHLTATQRVFQLMYAEAALDRLDLREAQS